VRSPEPFSREPQSPHPDSHRGVVTPAGCLVRLTPRRVPCPWLGRGGRAVLVRGNGAPLLASALSRAQGGIGCPPSLAPRSGYTRQQHGQACIPLPSPFPVAHASRGSLAWLRAAEWLHPQAVRLGSLPQPCIARGPRLPRPGAPGP